MLRDHSPQRQARQKSKPHFGLRGSRSSLSSTASASPTPTPNSGGARSMHQTGSPNRKIQLSPIRSELSTEEISFEWERHVEQALDSQALSQSWSNVVREKHLALQAAIIEVLPCSECQPNGACDILPLVTTLAIISCAIAGGEDTRKCCAPGEGEKGGSPKPRRRISTVRAEGKQRAEATNGELAGSFRHTVSVHAFPDVLKAHNTARFSHTLKCALTAALTSALTITADKHTRKQEEESSSSAS